MSSLQIQKLLTFQFKDSMQNKLEIQDISLADYPIESFVIDNNTLKLVSSGGADLRRGVRLGKLFITITGWKRFTGVKFVSSKPFAPSTEHAMNEEEFEEFDLIQEIKLENSKIKLSGFSKQSGAWIEYEIFGENGLPITRVMQ